MRSFEKNLFLKKYKIKEIKISVKISRKSLYRFE